MNSRRLFASILTTFLPGLAAAALTLPAGFTASDGALVATSLPRDGDGNYYIDLSQAATGVWTTAGPAGKGVYDPDQWAVVYKYSSVNINNTSQYDPLYFIGHPSGAPVIWLVDGNVTISGIVSLNGNGGRTDGRPSTPGPGGFSGSSSTSGGYGPGGAGRTVGTAAGSGGSYRSGGGGTWRGTVYGNSALFPLTGGSGGGAYTPNGYGGGAGGGALLIFSTGTITLNFMLSSVGGQGQYHSGSGSGGGFRLIGDTVTGAGDIYIGGGAGNGSGGAGGTGCARIEAVSMNLAIANTYAIPPYFTYKTLSPGDSPKVFIDTTAGSTDPYVKAIKFTNPDGSDVPATVPSDPRATLVLPTDVTLPAPGSYNLLIDCQNVPSDWIVSARFILTNGTDFTVKTPTITLESTEGNITHWKAPVTLPQYVTTVQVRVDAP